MQKVPNLADQLFKGGCAVGAMADGAPAGSEPYASALTWNLRLHTVDLAQIRQKNTSFRVIPLVLTR
jgi:hypothetical protein